MKLKFHLLFTVIHCGDPDGVSSSSATNYCDFYQCNVTYTCDENYQLEGNNTSYCEATKAWSEPPDCLGVYKVRTINCICHSLL